MKKTALKLCSILLVNMVLLHMGSASETAPGDIQFERCDADIESSVYAPSIFQHWKHRIHYRCDACHDSLFKMEVGATLINKALMKEGKVCGACHNGEITFPVSFENCNRCHIPDAK